MNWPENINNAQLQAILAQEPGTLILDVRTAEEYAYLGHIAGAKLLPVQELMSRVQELDPTQKTVVICQHGVRSFHAASFLAQSGFQQVLNHELGMASWDSSVVMGVDPG